MMADIRDSAGADVSTSMTGTRTAIGPESEGVDEKDFGVAFVKAVQHPARAPATFAE